MTLNIKELATKFVQENKPAGAILSNVENELAFKAYIDSSKATIEHLGKCGEFREFSVFITIDHNKHEYLNVMPYRKGHDQSVNCLKVIDHAALLSANAKIAKLEEELEKLEHDYENSIHGQNTHGYIAELQQRNKELEDFMNQQKTQTHFNLLVKANNRVKDLEALVGTLRGLTGCEDKTVKDVSVEQHSVDIMAKFKELESKLEHAQKIAYDRKNSVRKLEIEIKDAVEVIKNLKGHAQAICQFQHKDVIDLKQAITNAESFLSKRGGG